MNFEAVEQIAAAILYEGYILYPYRKSAIKNRQRWNFGTLYPRVYAERQRPQEPFHFVAELLAVNRGEATLHIKMSFLQLVRQQRSGGAQKLSDPSLAWEEAVERMWEHSELKMRDLVAGQVRLPVHLQGVFLPECRSSVPAPDLDVLLNISAEALGDGSCRVRLELENASVLASGADAKREEALPQSLVSAHLVLGVVDGEFVSLLDPSAEYKDSVADCNNVGVFPVLAGDEPDRTLMLCSPIILYDYPRIAPESEGDFFDGTEMDEMLTLRVLTLTDAEKDEMRQGDPRARRILERTESLTGEAMLKAHGVVRSLRAISEETS
jgi:hypothetical protein